MSSKLPDKDWIQILKRINAGKCTPFLGAGIHGGELPLGSVLAETWAKEYEYPLDDHWNLPRVAQYLAITNVDPMAPKEDMIERWFKNKRPPDFTKKDNPLRILADLPLPIYMTTNYDDWMVQALEIAGKLPKRELCTWNDHLISKDRSSVWAEKTAFTPKPSEPVVFHWHGIDKIYESLVLTEDDYIDFLVTLSKQKEIIPPRIQEALTETTLLFLGYRLTDWTFRVIFRGLVDTMPNGLRRLSIAVQLPPETSESKQKEKQEYLDMYFGNIQVKVYWGTADDFLRELSERWRQFNNGVKL